MGARFKLSGVDDGSSSSSWTVDRSGFPCARMTSDERQSIIGEVKPCVEPTAETIAEHAISIAAFDFEDSVNEYRRKVERLLVHCLSYHGLINTST